MEFQYQIPESFYSLFRSPNRDTYIEALLIISEEYQYNSYFLSRESCVRLLSDYFSQKKFQMEREENETELDMLETPANRILNWLLKSQWLKKLEDYYAQVTNIIIPDYAAIFIEAFERLANADLDSTEIYIQNIYAILFSLRNDKRANFNMLKTALVNTRKLNKSLQDMLHNMDKFFSGLLEKNFYGELLKEHLEGYVQEIIQKKYHILKTSDNFYIYKSDIKSWLHEMQQDYEWIQLIRNKEHGQVEEADIMEVLERIESGFDDIERRIANMDKEHMKYVKATVVRLNYLLNGEGSMKGLIIQLLNHMSQLDDNTKALEQTAEIMNLSNMQLLAEKSLYKRRAPRKNFIDMLEPEEEREELSKEEILRLNKIQHRFSRRQIEEYLEARMDIAGNVQIDEDAVQSDEDFEKLILAYDYAVKRNSRFQVDVTAVEMVDNGKYIYPKLSFIKKQIAEKQNDTE